MKLIEVGDEVSNHQGRLVEIDSVEVGKWGLFIRGKTIDRPVVYGCYVPYEFPPLNVWKSRCGWDERFWLRVNGVELSALGQKRTHPSAWDIEYYETYWQDNHVGFDEPARQKVY